MMEMKKVEAREWHVEYYEIWKDGIRIGNFVFNNEEGESTKKWMFLPAYKK